MPESTTGHLPRLTVTVATATVIANMVGTGVFTSLGFQVQSLESGLALLALWAVGGVIALCGALSYGELGAAIPGAGGEYRYLSHAYHPFAGTLAGWTSVSVGFAAPIALAAMALGRYAQPVIPLPPTAIAVAAVCLISLVHVARAGLGARFQVVTTSMKVLLIGAFIAAGLLAPVTGDASFAPTPAALGELLTPGFAYNLIYVTYAYSGWNAAIYLAAELEHPQRDVPRALWRGTLTVTLLYVALQLVFLRTVPRGTLAGQLEVGALSAEALFGAQGGRLLSAAISLLLVSTISAMVLGGPRVVEAMARDLPALAPLARRTPSGIPRNAVLTQLGITLVLILTGSFEQVMAYAGFTLTLVTMATTGAVLWLRRTEPDRPRAYRTWGYPVTPLLFLTMNSWIMVTVLRERPIASLAGLATMVMGAGVFAAVRRRA